MSDINITLPPTDGAERDAIHIAVIPLIAGETLYREDFFKLKFNSNDIALRTDLEDKMVLGIVNPFSEYIYEKGKRFWGFLLPNTVTGMRHHWTHPVFDRKPEKIGEHELWIRDFCNKWNFDYDELINNALSKDDSKYGRYVVARGVDLHYKEELGEDYELFWQHLAALTGQVFDNEHKEGLGWSCSC